MHMARPPLTAVDGFLDGDSIPPSIAGQEQGAFIRIAALEVHDVFGIVKTQGRAVVGQVAQTGVAPAGENDVPQVAQLRDEGEELASCRCLVPRWATSTL